MYAIDSNAQFLPLRSPGNFSNFNREQKKKNLFILKRNKHCLLGKLIKKKGFVILAKIIFKEMLFKKRQKYQY